LHTRVVSNRAIKSKDAIEEILEFLENPIDGLVEESG
jgi:hypothetical protein